MPGRVVLTRQPAQAGDVEAGLRAAGYAVRFLPLTDFELPADLEPLRAAVRRLRAGEYAWLMATSPNTVRALARAGWDGSLPADVRVAVTGPGTARVLAAAGCPVPPWMPEGDASAAGIAAAFPAVATGAGGVPGRPGRTRVLLPQSALATDEVAAALAGRGWAVDRVEAYRTVPYPAAPGRRLLPDDPGTDGTVLTLRELEGAVVVLTSPSAVRELTRRWAVEGAEVPGARFVAIGQPTRRAAQRAGLGLAGTAPSPDAAGLLAVLEAPQGRAGR